MLVFFVPHILAHTCYKGMNARFLCATYSCTHMLLGDEMLVLFVPHIPAHTCYEGMKCSFRTPHTAGWDLASTSMTMLQHSSKEFSKQVELQV